MKRFNDRFIRTAPAGRFTDAQTPGLQLFVKPSGARSFVLRVQVRGRSRDIGLGGLRDVTLEEARTKARELRRAAKRGELAPATTAPCAAHGPTVAEAIAEWLADQPGTDRTKRNRAVQCERIQETLGARRVDMVTAPEVADMLRPIWTSKHPTAKKVLAHAVGIFSRQRAAGTISANCCDDVRALLPKVKNGTNHRKADPHGEIASLLAQVEGSKAPRSLKAMIALVAHSGVRSGEARGARWNEIDLDAATWTIPASRMKMDRDHVVPLSGPMLYLLRALPSESELVFPNPRSGGQEYHDSALSNLWKRVGGETVHGLRSAIRDWCGENGIAREVAEAVLAHSVGGVEGAYFRTTMIERRRPVMAEWSAYLAG